MDDSFGRESPSSNLSEVAINMAGSPEPTGSQSSTLCSPVNVYDSPRSSRSPLGSVNLNRRQDSGKASHPVPASPLRTFGPAEFLEAEGSTPEELRAEARMWERNARKLKVDLDLSRNETVNQGKKLENVSMELSALKTECNGLKDEIKHLKFLLAESEVKERDADNLKVQLQDKNDVLAELNENLSLQLNKTQDANLELVSALQKLEENIKNQRPEIESLKASERPTGESNDSLKLELYLQKFQESQRFESIVVYLEKTLEEKSQSLWDSESEWTEKLSLKDKEIVNLEAKLLEALAARVAKETESHTIETPDFVEEVKALKEKVLEHERDCDELTDEIIELLCKLKESGKDFSTNGTSVSSSLGERRSTESPNIGDSETGWQIKGETKKMKSGEIAAGYMQIRCHDLESKCIELEVQMQSFKDRASHLHSELERYREKAAQQENEIAALKQLLKCQVEEQHENSFGQYEQAAAEDNVQCGEEEIKRKSKDIYNERDGSFEDNEDTQNLVIELKSKVEDLGKELLAKTSAIDGITSDCSLKEHEIQSQKNSKRDLEAQLSDMQIVNSELEESSKGLQKEVDDTNDNHISSSKILEKTLLELESQELEHHLAELEEDNHNLSGRISGLEPQLRYLTDARESSRLEAEHSVSQIVKLQAEVEGMENDVETKVDMRQNVQDMQNQWLESQEECEYLKWIKQDKVEENESSKFPSPRSIFTSVNSEVPVPLKDNAPNVTITHSPLKVPSESPQKKPAFQMSAPDDSFEIDDDDDDDDEVHVNGHVSFPLVENKKPDTSLVTNKLAAANSIEFPKLPEVPKTPELVVNNESVSTEVAKIPEQAELKEAENATSSKTSYGLFSEPRRGMKLPPSPPSTTTTQTSVLLQSNLQTEKVAPEKGSSPSPFLFGTTVEKVSPFQFSVKEPSVFKLDATSDPKEPESNSVISSVPKNDHVKFSVSNKDDNVNGNDQNSENMLGKSELKSFAVPLATSTNGTFSFDNPTNNASTPNTASASDAPAFPSTNGTILFGSPANNASTPNAASSSNAPSLASSFPVQASGINTNSLFSNISPNVASASTSTPISTTATATAATTSFFSTSVLFPVFSFESTATPTSMAETGNNTNATNDKEARSNTSSLPLITASFATTTTTRITGSGLFGSSSPAVASTTTALSQGSFFSVANGSQANTSASTGVTQSAPLQFGSGFSSSPFGAPPPAFVTSTPAFGASATPAFGASAIPAFGSSAPAFGSSSPAFAGSFQFAGQPKPNQKPPQNPFQSSSVKFNAGGGSFSSGSDDDKSGRRIVIVKTKNRRK